MDYRYRMPVFHAQGDDDPPPPPPIPPPPDPWKKPGDGDDQGEQEPAQKQ